jgi:hypothetical protein
MSRVCTTPQKGRVKSFKADHTGVCSPGSSPDDDWPMTPDPFEDDDLRVPGPLTSSLIAMLGNGSWFHPIGNITTFGSDAASNATMLSVILSACTRGSPLAGFFFESSFYVPATLCSQMDWEAGRYGGLALLLESIGTGLFNGFASPEDAQKGLDAAMFFANEALLVETVNAGNGFGGGASPIYTSAGTAVIKPSVSLTGKIVVSVFIGIEVLALLALLGYIYHVPTFGSRIDAFTIAAMGAQLVQRGARLRAIGLRDKKALQGLEQADGLIGLHNVAEQALEMTLFGAQAPARAEADGMHDDGLSSKTVSVDLPNDARHGSRRPPTPPRPRYRLDVGAEGVISRRWKRVYERPQGNV